MANVSAKRLKFPLRVLDTSFIVRLLSCFVLEQTIYNSCDKKKENFKICMLKL